MSDFKESQDFSRSIAEQSIKGNGAIGRAVPKYHNAQTSENISRSLDSLLEEREKTIKNEQLSDAIYNFKNAVPKDEFDATMRELAERQGFQTAIKAAYAIAGQYLGSEHEVMKRLRALKA